MIRDRSRELARRMWMKYALRKVKQNDAHDRLDLAYRIEDPWHMNADREKYRFAETNRVIERAFGERVKSILEVGSGEGHQTEHLAKVTDAITGIEVSSHAVARARKRVPSATFIAGDLLAQPWAKERGRFGLVTACEVLYYMSDIPRFLRTMDELGESCLVTYFAPAGRLCKAPLAAMPGLEETKFRFEEDEWVAAWWPGASKRSERKA